MERQLVAIRRVGAMGRIVVPETIRNLLHLEPGVPIKMYVDSHTMVISRIYQGEMAQEWDNPDVHADILTVLESMYSDIARGALSQKDFIKMMTEGHICHTPEPENTITPN